MIRSLLVASLLTASSLALLPSDAAAAKLKKTLCSGEFGTGSGLAGSYIGKDCFIAADSDMQEQVAGICKEGSRCEVEAMVEVAPDGSRQIRTVLSVRQAGRAPATRTSYAQRAGNYADGIYALQDDGCDKQGATPGNRVSVQLLRAAGPAIQLYGKYCAVIEADGEEPSSAKFQATLQLRCGSSPAQDQALRSGRSGTAETIVMTPAPERQLWLDEDTLIRCPIKRAYTPQWWIEAPPFNGRYPQ
ncbi:hypothetical protein AB4037_00135 [Labrys sp. KB_33_2]|uniref:hypothetical protein n=1 Tax=Labrys sp. KB_33_2 TaxID=3237479 RepID=UPI003F937AF5